MIVQKIYLINTTTKQNVTIVYQTELIHLGQIGTILKNVKSIIQKLRKKI